MVSDYCRKNQLSNVINIVFKHLWFRKWNKISFLLLYGHYENKNVPCVLQTIEVNFPLPPFWTQLPPELLKQSNPSIIGLLKDKPNLVHAILHVISSLIKNPPGQSFFPFLPTKKDVSATIENEVMCHKNIYTFYKRIKNNPFWKFSFFIYTCL